MSDPEPIEGYRVPAGCCDELLDDDGTPAAPRRAADGHAARGSAPRPCAAAGQRRDTIFMQQGITFEVAGTDGERRDRAWPLDLVPRVLPAAEWTTIKRGLAQRIRALNAFVDDVYHAHEIVRAGIVPVVADRQPPELRAAGARRPRPRRRLLPRLRLRSGPRRRRPLARARGQRPHAVGDLLRAREPARDDAADARAVRRAPRPRRRPLPVAAARRAAGRRPAGREPPDRRRCGRPAR